MRVGVAGPVNIPALSEYLQGTDMMPHGLGGAPVTALVLGLLHRGIRVAVYTLDPSVLDDQVLSGETLTVYVGRYRPRARDRAIDLFKSERTAIGRFVFADRPDVVNAHWTYEFALGALSIRPDTVVTVHDWAPSILSMQRDAYRFTRLLMDRRCIRKARTLTCVSPHIARLLERVGLGSVVVPNMSPPASARARSTTLTGTAVVISVANGFGRLKNVASLLEAHALLRSGRPDVIMRLVGSEMGIGEAAHVWAAKMHLDAGVEFVGRLDHDAVLAAMRQADLLIHPSLEESFGMVLVEAMSVGTPVIGGFRSGAVPWVLGDGASGMLVDVEDPVAIAHGVDGLLSNDQARHLYSQSGLAQVGSRFSEPSVVQGYLDTYRQVIAR